MTTPWKDMVKSAPLWALLICHSCSNWADYTLMTSLPVFMKEVLRFDIKSVSIFHLSLGTFVNKLKFKLRYKLFLALI